MSGGSRSKMCEWNRRSAVAAPDAVCGVGDVVDRQTVQTGWDDDMEKQAEALFLKI